MQLTAPYSNEMRIGQGFNSYTHEVRIDNAVQVDDTGKHDDGGHTKAIQRDSGIDVADTRKAVDGTVRTTGPATSQGEAPSLSTAVVNPPFPNNSAPRTALGSSKQVTPRQVLAAAQPEQAYHITDPVWKSKQSVTYSSWQVDNVSEIADALNISSAARVKYAAVGASADVGIIHDDKVRNSQLNYVVSVKVINDSQRLQEPMEFQPIKDMPPEEFTPVYGDCFISGFLEGGEFQAIISIKVHDKKKLRQVKEAVDLKLAIPAAPGLQVGASEDVNKDHNEAYKNTETSISVRCIGGGVTKDPSYKWTLDPVTAIANAFPSLVALCPSTTFAVLTKYTALKSFHAWVWKMVRDPEWKTFVEQDNFMSRLIYCYEPCHIYAAALFEDLMTYKDIQRRIREIMKHPTSYKKKAGALLADIPEVSPLDPPAAFTLTSPKSVPDVSPHEDHDDLHITPLGRANRGNTFNLENPSMAVCWKLSQVDNTTGALPVDISTMKAADLLCRAALTLITEEAARLVDHPHNAYAEFNAGQHIRLNKPNYPIPELLLARLPVFSDNDANENVLSDDEAVIRTWQHADGDDLYFHLVGDVPNRHHNYRFFCTLDIPNPDPRRRKNASINAVRRLSIHAYRHRKWNWGDYWKRADYGIGSLGMAWTTTPQPEKWQTRAGQKFMSLSPNPDKCTHHFGGPARSSESENQSLDLSNSDGISEASSIARLDVQYVPGEGRIAALVFYESPPKESAISADKALPVLAWRQWEHDGSDGREPDQLTTVTLSPPQDDGNRWAFVGLCGAFDVEGLLRGGGCVLSRVSGIWRKL